MAVKKLGFLFVGGFLLVVGCSRKEEAPKAEESRPVVAEVRAETVKLQPLPEVVEAVGTVRSRRQSVLSSRIVASIVAVHGREGDRVKAGQVVVELDDRDIKAQLQRAEAGLREARDALKEVERAIQAQEKAIEAAKAQEALALATFTRYQRLLERRSVAPQEFDEVAAKHQAALAEVLRAEEIKASLLAKREQLLARIEQAKAEVENAQVVVGYAKIPAPIHGIVVAKAVEVGNLAAPGLPLLTIEEERYRLEAAVQESEIGEIRRGWPADVALEALGQTLRGSVVEIVPAADPLSRTFTVKIDLPPTPGLRSGLYGKARFTVGQQKALVIPRKAIVERGQLEGVFVLDQEHTAHLRLVKTGKGYGDLVEILSGLRPGEQIVVEGIEKVSDGSRVEVKR